jgi:NodT family efflux transporter outer membrane factor (OMF) lipoprotein
VAIGTRPKHFKSATILALACGVGGCAVGPKYVKPEVKVNQNWNERADSTLRTQAPLDSVWWRAFNDSVLNQLIQLAYHQNLPLQISGLRIMESRAQLALAVGRQYPQLQAAFGSATAIGLTSQAADATGLDRNVWNFQAGFDAFWELDFWHKYRSGVQAQAASYFSSIADYDNSLVSLTAEVARTYAAIRTFEVLISQARANVTVQEEGLRIAQSRFQNGATSELDVTQATTLLENTRASIPQLQISLQQAQNALSTLLGQPTGTVQTILAGAQGIPVPPAAAAISVPAEMLRRRPDIRNAELSAVAQGARIGVAKADLYPSFSLFGSIGTESFTGGGLKTSNQYSLFSGGSLFYSFGPKVVWSFLNYGRLQNSVRIEDARFQQLLVGYQDAVIKAAQEVEDGLAGFIHAQEAAVFSENAVRGAQRSVELSFIQYREGAVDFQRVLDAQRSLLEEQNNLTQTRSAIVTDLIAVYKALGGGWELREGQPFIEQRVQQEMQNRTNWGDLLSTQPKQGPPPGSPPTPR